MTDHRRLRVAARDDLGDPVAVAERGDERRRVARRRDEVEVAHRLAAPADAARLGDGESPPGARRARRRRAARPEAPVASRRRSSASSPTPASSAFRIFSSLRAPIPERSRSRPALGGRLQPVERRDPELRPDPRRRLRADSGKPQEVDDTGRHEAASLRERVHLAVLDDLDDLVLDRLADPRAAPSPCPRARARRSAAGTRGSAPPRAGTR